MGLVGTMGVPEGVDCTGTTESTPAPCQVKLLELQHRRPVLSGAYDASCWSYSIVGAVLLRHRTMLPYAGR